MIMTMNSLNVSLHNQIIHPCYLLCSQITNSFPEFVIAKNNTIEHSQAISQLRAVGNRDNVTSLQIGGIETKNVNSNVEDIERINYFTVLPIEMVQLILSYLDSSALTKLACTCRKLNRYCITHDKKWKKLCAQDFDVHLTSFGQFLNYYNIYRLLYSSRLLIGAFVYARYFSKSKLTPLPAWLMTWASLSNQPPMMRFGRHRIKKRISGHYFKRFNDLPYGQIRKIFDLDGFNDLLDMIPTRMEKSTMYFSWQSIKLASMRKYGKLEFEQYLLDKCYRARGFIERNFEKIHGSDPLKPL